MGRRSNHAIITRQRRRVAFYHHGLKICMATFLKLHGIGMHSVIVMCTSECQCTCYEIFQEEIDSLHSEYTMQRRGCSMATTTGCHTTHSPTKNVVKFLQNYSENHAILLPGRIPGYKRDDLQLLPSSTTKKVRILLHRTPSPCRGNLLLGVGQCPAVI